VVVWRVAHGGHCSSDFRRFFLCGLQFTVAARAEFSKWKWLAHFSMRGTKRKIGITCDSEAMAPYWLERRGEED
jgi:hypothetical protein